MSKCKLLLMAAFVPSLFIFQVSAEQSGNRYETRTSSIFSFFKNEQSFQDALKDSALITPNVRGFYERMNFQPIWFAQGILNLKGKIARDVLLNAHQEGLDPQDYAQAIAITDKPDQWMEAEFMLTKTFLKFIDDVRVGRIDPTRISKEIKFHSPKTHAVELLITAIEDENTNGDKLRRMAPNIAQYADLKRILADYRARASDQNEELKLTGTTPLKAGDKSPDVITLRRILILHGTLSPDQEKGEEFDAELATALRAFQKRYSLETDGSVGPKTRDVLNCSLQAWIKKAIVNMERLRWLPDDLGHRHIIVNVAGYVLHGFENSAITLMIPVIVGRPDRPTPLFYATLKNIVLNPSWSVPHSIFVSDKLPKIRHDPGYIRRANYTVTDCEGREIDPDAADWENEGKSYYLRQSPGQHNALGQIKFNIENPYTIYMHGTPDQHLFDRNARAFSSGCIRLKYPLKLAEWVLNNESQWSYESMKAAINTGKTQTIKPQEYVPVYFTYQTIWVKDTQKGRQIFFSNDPYGLDARMVRMLKVS